MKVCSKCGLEKELQAFSPRKSGSEVRRTWCKACSSRVKHLRKKYRITTEQVTQMLTDQDGLCQTCGVVLQPVSSAGISARDSLAVDHSHQTGEVRGLLCHRCNLVLGMLDDNPVLLRRLAKYLEDAQ